MSTTVDSNQSEMSLMPVSMIELETYITSLQTGRAGEHSDYGTITLLFQDDIGGLEVLKKSGEWFPARPIPDTGTLLILPIFVHLFAPLPPTTAQCSSM
jgi:isopenicillin N synthase-like dioxygenase